MCPLDNTNVFERDRKRTFVWHMQFLSLLKMMTKNEASRIFSRNHALLPIRLVLVVALQNMVRPFLLKITAVFFSYFAVMPNSVGCSVFRTFTDPLPVLENEIDFMFGHKNFFCFQFILNTLQMCGFPLVHQRLLRVGLLSSFCTA